MKALTEKQKGVCDLIACGFTSKQISTRLGISHRTVEWHRGKIYERLGVKNAAEMVRALLETEGAKVHG